MLLTDHGRTDEARQLLVDLALDAAERHEDGLLRLAHRRRAADAGSGGNVGTAAGPRRRLDDVVPSSTTRMHEVHRATAPDQTTEPAAAWTSSTT